MRISDWSSDVCSSDLPRHDRRSARSGDSLSRPRNYPDLPTLAAFAPCRQANIATLFSSWNGQEAPLPDRGCKARAAAPQGQGLPLEKSPRSEEHTSDLPSLMRSSYDVFCLKKK